ncbi:hypothetical protein [Nocardia sp. NPDC051463]|uniref:hypothetical protein n=1 Tax=Nocardia sp. NPDC051463 TaxID=3154845 RepID=UPI003450A3DB
MPENTSDELIAAIDLVNEALKASGQEASKQLVLFRRDLTARADCDLAIGRSFAAAWDKHLDSAGIAHDERVTPTPLLAGRLIRAAVESAGASITPPIGAGKGTE